jgi:hypothetical protein
MRKHLGPGEVNEVVTIKQGSLPLYAPMDDLLPQPQPIQPDALTVQATRFTDYRAPHPARTLPQGLAHLRPTYGDAIRAAEQAQARVSER